MVHAFRDAMRAKGPTRGTIKRRSNTVRALPDFAKQRFQANDIRARVSEAESNAISVRIELQADCYSGIRTRHAEEWVGTLEPGDVEEATNAARQIGEDTLQRDACRVPMPHSFTDGTRERRKRWFATRYRIGDLAAFGTFGAERP